MKIDVSKLLKGILANAYKKADGEIDELLNSSDENAQETILSTILSWDKERIDKAKTPPKGQSGAEQYARGKKETMEALEKTIREQYELEGDETKDLTGMDLINHVVTSKVKTAGKPPAMTEDDVRKHPVFVNAEKAHKKALKDQETEWQGKVTGLETAQKRAGTLATVGTRAWDAAMALNPAIPKTQAVADTTKANFLKEFEAFDYDIQPDGKTILLMKDGKVHTDAHGHNVTLDDFTKATAAKYYEFAANNGGGSPNNGGAGGAGGGAAGAGGAGGKQYPAGVVKPKTEAELFALLNNETIKVEDRLIISETWQNEAAGAGGAST